MRYNFWIDRFPVHYKKKTHSVIVLFYSLLLLISYSLKLNFLHYYGKFWALPIYTNLIDYLKLIVHLSETFSSFITARIRRMGKVMFSVCSHLGEGYPYPIMLCNITQNAMGQLGGGVPCQVQPGGYPARGGTLAGGYPGRGVTLPRGYLVRVPPRPGQDGGVPS